jgi:hypothetical protein
MRIDPVTHADGVVLLRLYHGERMVSLAGLNPTP